MTTTSSGTLAPDPPRRSRRRRCSQWVAPRSTSPRIRTSSLATTSRVGRRHSLLHYSIGHHRSLLVPSAGHRCSLLLYNTAR
ncbi:hypothetical protein E2562_037205 [Oryza meyeriana var. granulata]|uniref:Uncharacterized protein n=1 Tax=Oryza meyeriana var. granulata TaxID=110450 RepID=A0A6G1CBQ1_9ORYZ|nr:hypothetical protein E2562_037205 [Oryza meyeriana var. granulata]